MEDSLLLPLLFFGGMLAGWVDSIAGGGGLISLPLLIHAGLSPTMALGTNKLQSSFGSFSSSFRYIRSKVIDLKTAIPGVIFTLIGAAIGTILVQRIQSDILIKIIPILLFLILIYVVLMPKIIGHDMEQDGHAKLPFNLTFFILGISLGFYDGFFGPGTGNFWVVLLIILAGINMKKATAYTKLMNFTSNIVAFSLFAINGNVVYKIGLIMALGQIIGARIGAGMVLKHGTKFIRPIFITIVLVLIVSLTIPALR